MASWLWPRWLSPLLRLELDLPDGRHFEKLDHFPASAWSAAHDHADVRLGDNRFTGDLHTYRIEATAEEVSVDVTLIGEIPAWRPGSGYMLFGKDRSLEFAWLPSVPQGAVRVRYTVDGERHKTTGVGYHDHNWGNVGLMKVVHDWYWARGQAGPYSVIASYITSAKRYGFEPIPIFMLAHDNIVIGDDPAKVAFEREGVYTDETTGKPVATTTRYTYQDGAERYVVSFTRTRDLTLSPMIDNIRGFKHIAARLAHFDGAYLRFAGDLDCCINSNTLANGAWLGGGRFGTRGVVPGPPPDGGRALPSGSLHEGIAPDPRDEASRRP